MSAFEDAHPLNATGNQNAMRQVRRRVTAQVRPGQFLGELEYVAVEFKWTPDELASLSAFCAGETVQSIGPKHAVTASGRDYDRTTGAEWVNPYQADWARQS